MIKPINITFEEKKEKFDVPIFSPDGFSPLAKTYRTEDGTVLEVTDNRGTTTSLIHDGDIGPQGPPGEQGVSIVDVRETHHTVESGEPNVVTVTLSNGQEYSFTVYNGNQGERGDKGEQGDIGPVGPRGPSGIGLEKALVGTDGRLYFYFVNGTMMVVGNVVGPQGEQGIQGIPGEKGERGEQGERGLTGVGIDHISQTRVGTGDESINIVTVYLDNGRSYTFQVENGSKGKTGAQGPKGDTGPRGYGISNTLVGTDGKLYIYFENGTMMIAGDVKGDPGPAGPQGEPGVVQYFEQATEPQSANSGALWLDTSI